MTARHVESVVSEMKGAGKIRPTADSSTWGIVGSHDRLTISEAWHDTDMDRNRHDDNLRLLPVQGT